MAQPQPSNDYDRSKHRPHAVTSNTDAASQQNDTSPAHLPQLLQHLTGEPVTSDSPQPAAQPPKQHCYMESHIELYVQSLSGRGRRKSPLHHLVTATAQATENPVVDSLDASTHTRKSYATVAMMSAPKMLLMDVASTASVIMSMVKMIAHGHHHGNHHDSAASHHGETLEHGIDGLESDGLKLQKLNGDSRRGLTARFMRSVRNVARHPRTMATIHTLNDVLHDTRVLAGLSGLYGYLAIKTGHHVHLDMLPQPEYLFDLAKTAVYSVVATTATTGLVRNIRHQFDERAHKAAEREARAHQAAIESARTAITKFRARTERIKCKWETDQDGRLVARWQITPPGMKPA